MKNCLRIQREDTLPAGSFLLEELPCAKIKINVSLCAEDHDLNPIDKETMCYLEERAMQGFLKEGTSLINKETNEESFQVRLGLYYFLL